MPRKKKTEIVEPVQEVVEPVQEVIEPVQEVVEPAQEIIEPVQEVLTPKEQALKDFYDLWMRISHGPTSLAVAKQIWEYWQIYTGRVEKFNGCGSCLPPRVAYMIKECRKAGYEGI